MTRSYHGTGEQAIEWIINQSGSYETSKFLRQWQQGNAEKEWPEFYEWLDKQEGPKVGDGTGDAAVAIGEHAFRAGWDACDEASGVQSERRSTTVERAWGEYDPPEHIKALS
jgi:hypothetical protein